MKKILFFSFIILAFFSVTSCSDVVPEVTFPAGTTDYFKSNVDFDSNAGEKIITFTSNVSWTASVDETRDGSTWCKVSPTSGSKGENTIKISVDENTTYDDRNAVVRLKYGETTKNIYVNQKQMDAITLTSDRFEVPATGGNIEVEVKSNIDYTYEIAEDCKDWIHSSAASSSRGLTASTLSFTIDPSTEYAKREGSIIIMNGDKKEVVKVYQVGAGIITLTKHVFSLSDLEQEITIEISSNFDYEVEMPDVSWISESKYSRSVSTHTMKIHVDANNTYDWRFAVIRFYDKNSDASETVFIDQKQKDALTLTTNDFEVPIKGGDIDVEVKANIDYTYEIPDDSKDWIHRVESRSSRGLTSSVLRFTIDPSTEYDKREGHINIISGDKKEVVNVYQVGAGIITLTSNVVELSSSSHAQVPIKFSSNFDYEVEMPDVDWISKVSSRALTSHQLNIKVKANDAYESRTATIRVYDPKGSTSETITIIQKQKDALLLDNSTYEFDENGGTFTVNVNTNVNYQIKINDNWVTEVSAPASRGLVASSHSFKVAKMSDGASRETRIQFTDKATGVKKNEIVVKQINSFWLNNSSVELSTGDKLQLSLTNTTGSSVTWKSSNNSVATVDNNGNVTAVARGTATITATTADGKHEGECKVTVKDITDYISVGCSGGSIISVGTLIKYGSKLNWYFTNNSKSTVTLTSMQLVDGETGSAGNEMSVGEKVSAGQKVSYTTTIGLAGIHTPVTCRFKFEYNGKSYTVSASYTGSMW